MGRKMPVEKVNDIAQGRVWSGVAAKEINLVDGLDGKDGAFRKAKELAGLDPTKLYSVDRYKPKNPSFAECLKSSDLNECFSSMGLNISTVMNPFKAIAKVEDIEKILTDDYRQMFIPISVDWNRKLGAK